MTTPSDQLKSRIKYAMHEVLDFDPPLTTRTAVVSSLPLLEMALHVYSPASPGVTPWIRRVPSPDTDIRPSAYRLLTNIRSWYEEH